VLEKSCVPLLTDVSEFINLMVLFVESLGSTPLVNSRWHDGLCKGPCEIRIWESFQVECFGTDFASTSIGRYWKSLIVSRVFEILEFFGVDCIIFLRRNMSVFISLILIIIPKVLC
jgi:hypothetical protein